MASETLTWPELERLLLSARPDPEDVLTTALDSPFFRLLAATNRQLLDDLMTEQTYAPGEIIFREGEPGDAMYIIWSGRVAIVKGDFQKPTILGYRRTGDIIGEMAMLDDQPRSASIVTLENVRLLKVSREDFQELLQSNPAIGMSILEILSSRLRKANEARSANALTQKRSSQSIPELPIEKKYVLELERLRRETTDLITHELRDPLSNLFTVIKMLEMVLPPDILQTNQSLFDMANSNIELMQQLVDTLLDIISMEEDEIQLELTMTSISNLVEIIIERLKPFAQEKQITLEMTIPAELPPIALDGEKIGRVLAHLMDNALKHTPAQGQVSISAELSDNLMRVSVTDLGSAIPAEDQERIFDRFAQVSGNAFRNRELGLKLTFCQLVIEAHGGRIWVETGPGGVGNQFIFTLPLYRR